jgi:prephenate dehydrogenase
VWKDIVLSNPKPILKALDETVKVLAAMRKAIVARDQEVLVDIFKQAKAKREGLDKGHAG